MGKVNKLNILLIILWAIIAIFAMFHHEIWRDEAQVWCIVRDLGIIDIFKMARIEGHPILWYLLVMPFAKLGLPVISMQLVSFILVAIAVSLLIFKSPFNTLEKILICFSAGMIYYLPIVSRNYSLIPLFLFIIAILYPERFKYPYFYAISIIMLSQTHIYMLGLCGILFLIFVFESIKDKLKQNIKPILLIVLNFIFLFVCFYHSINENYALTNGVNNILPLKSVVVMISQILTFQIINLIPQLHKYFNIISICLFFPFIGVIIYKFFMINKKLFLIFFVAIGFMLYVFTNVYFNGILYQKSFLLFLIIIFCYWILQQEYKIKSKLLSISFCFLFLISFLTSPIVLADEIKYNFSGGKQIAEYIKSNLNEEKVFIAYGNPYVYSPISAYLPEKKLYSVVSENYISYYSFQAEKTNEKIEFPQNAKYYIVHDEIKDIEEKGFKILFKSQERNLSSRTQEEIFSICLFL